MNVPQIRIQSQPMQIGLNIEKPVQEIEQPEAVLSIQQPKAKMEIHTTAGKLNIDQTQAWRDMDLKHVSVRVKENAQYGYQQWLSGLARKAEQGDELMRIENGGNPIAEQAKRNSERPYKQLGIGWIPSHFSVKLYYEPAKVDIQAEPQKPRVEAQPQKVIHRYHPGSVSTYVEKFNSLEIDFVG